MAGYTLQYFHALTYSLPATSSWHIQYMLVLRTDVCIPRRNAVTAIPHGMPTKYKHANVLQYTARTLIKVAQRRTKAANTAHWLHSLIIVRQPHMTPTQMIQMRTLLNAVLAMHMYIQYCIVHLCVTPTASTVRVKRKSLYIWPSRMLKCINTCCD